MPGMVSQLNLQADRPAVLFGQSGAFQRRRLLGHAVPGAQRARRRSSRPGSQSVRGAGPMLDRAAYTQLARQSQNVTPFTYRRRRSAAVPRHRHADRSRRARARSPKIRAHAGREVSTGGRALTMFGKLELVGDPVRPADPADHLARDHPGRSLGVLGLVTVKGWWPYLWREWITSVDHKRIGIMYCLLGVVMLVRGFADAIMMRTQQAVAIERAGLSAARALQPDLLGPRHDHDLLRGHAAGDRLHELRGAAAARACATWPSRP